jgi:hypothetical protein
MRGHKLALIWLGHSLPDLRKIRGTSVGAEKGHTHKIIEQSVYAKALKKCTIPEELSPSTKRMIERYICDAVDLMKSMRKSLKDGGKLVLVIGDSCHKGIVIPNADYFSISGGLLGLKLVERMDRDLPLKSRYLPVPTNSNNSLARRMTKETVLSFTAV